jgi:hypothetical protein
LCRADLDDDGIVKLTDLGAFKATFLQRCEPYDLRPQPLPSGMD